MRTTDWFPCVHELVRGTAAADIWSTPLYDRAPMLALPKHLGARVTVLGDACHPMSMFKGRLRSAQGRRWMHCCHPSD